MVARNQNLNNLCTMLGMKVATAKDVVHKHECFYSTDTPRSPGGLYINLQSFQSFGQDMLKYDRNGDGAIYLHAKSYYTPLLVIPGVEPETSTVRLEEKLPYEEITEYCVYSAKLGHVPLSQVDGVVREICESVIQHAGFEFKHASLEWAPPVLPSKYATSLVQVDNPRKIEYGNFTCQQCGAKKNLWLNLSDGFIGCGRKHIEGGGCQDGSEGAAIQHYHETGRLYPLAVKIGTICSQGADVYSYAEDDMVSDPFLEKHLLHFGIKICQLSKTEKTTLQLEKEVNEQHDFTSVVTGSNFYYAPGIIGLDNLGNSCFLNSTLQLLFNIPRFSKVLVDGFENLAESSSNSAPLDVLLQLSKVAVGIVTDRFFKQHAECNAIYESKCRVVGVEVVKPDALRKYSFGPRMLMYSIGNVTSQFVKGQQHDVEEFASFLLNHLVTIDSDFINRTGNTMGMKHLFFFKTRQTLICEDLKFANYIDNETHVLSLPVLPSGADVEAAATTLEACFNLWRTSEDVSYLDDKTKTEHTACLSNDLVSSPEYLLLHLRRFYVNKDWTASKIAHDIQVPLGPIQFKMFEPKPQVTAEYTCEYTDTCNKPRKRQAKFEADASLITMLQDMGFTKEQAKMAAEATNNGPADTCVNWILENPNTTSSTSSCNPRVERHNSVNEADVSQIMELGYTRAQATRALSQFSNVESAIDDLLSNPQEYAAASLECNEPAGSDTAVTSLPLSPSEESARYEVVAFVTHVGTTANSGHYICHVKHFKTQEWLTYNDSEITRCDQVPINTGYLYLLRKL